MAANGNAVANYGALHVRGTKGIGAGRSLHASRDLAPGELIATFTSPILALPDGPSSRTTCSHCLCQHPKLRACTGCKAIVYCSPECQKANWKLIHKRECKAYMRVQDSVNKDWLPTPVRALVQVLLRWRDPVVTDALEQLQSNKAAFKAKKEVWQDFELQAYGGLKYADLRGSAAELELAMDILCKIQTNAFDRSDADIGQSGIFLDPVLAMANHSCMANAVVGFHKRKAYLRAEAPIKEGDEITISYIDYTKPKTFRQLGLKLYHFECSCIRCKNDLDIYEACKRSPIINLNSLSLVPDLGRYRKPPIADATVKDQIDNMYSACNPVAIPPPDERLPRLQFQWQQCKPLIEANLWALEPLGSLIDHAVVYYADQGNFAHALSVACFGTLNCDPYRHVAPFKQWRLKGITGLAKMLTNTAPYTAMTELAKISHPGVMAVLNQADQVSICQAMLLMVAHYAPMAHSDEWEILSLAKTMLRDIESLEGRERESTLLRAWVSQDSAGTGYFRTQVLKPIEDLAGFAVDILSLELGSR